GPDGRADRSAGRSSRRGGTRAPSGRRGRARGRRVNLAGGVVGESVGEATTLPGLDVELSSGRGGAPVALVRIADFDWPLALLLALIEARELDILSIPLGDLAEAFLDAVAGVAGERLGSLSGFVSVAARLTL